MKHKIINADLVKLILSLILILIAYLFIENPNIFKTLLFISYIIVSCEVYFNAIKNIKDKEFFDENILMIIATLGAFYIGKYTEAVAVMFLFSLGEYLSEMAVNNSKKAIIELMDLRSENINIKNVGIVDITTAEINDVFMVKPGEKVPLDGIIIKGTSHLDTSSLTGESKPKRVNKNDTVLSGSLNLESLIEVKATSTYKTSTASKIIEIMENSDEKKSNSEKFITRFSKVYTPVVIIISFLVVTIPSIITGDFYTWLYRGLELLVISCPCALVISIPLGFFCGIGRASRERILIKGSDELDRLNKIDTVIFDKTGTITEGTFALTKIVSKNITKEELLKLVATVENNSNHPIAKSIKSAYKKEIVDKVKNFKEISGSGIKCEIDNQKVVIGTSKFLKEEGVNSENIDEIGTVLHVAKNNEYLGYLVINDRIKNNAKKSLNDLKNNITNIVLLSGDNYKNVENIAQKLNFDDFYGELLPQDKVKIVKDYQKNNYVAFVGDGINDAPVIKSANVGFAMGALGSDAAIEASDIVLMDDDLNQIGEAIKIAKMTKIIIMSNITFAITFKIVMLLLAIMGKTSIWLAVFADVGVTLISILNSLRIMWKRIK